MSLGQIPQPHLFKMLSTVPEGGVWLYYWFSIATDDLVKINNRSSKRSHNLDGI